MVETIQFLMRPCRIQSSPPPSRSIFYVPSILPDHFEAAAKDCANPLLSLNPLSFTGVNLEDNQNLNLLHTLFGFKVWAEAAIIRSICPIAFWLCISSFSGKIESCSSCSICTSAERMWNLPLMQEYVTAVFKGAQFNQRSLISPPPPSQPNATALLLVASQQNSSRKTASSSISESAVSLQSSYLTFISTFWRKIIERCEVKCILCNKPTCYGYYSGGNPCEKLKHILGGNCCHYCGCRNTYCSESECCLGGNISWPKPGTQRNICIHCFGNDPLDFSCFNRVRLKVKAVVLAALHEMSVQPDCLRLLFKNVNDPNTTRAIRIAVFEYVLVMDSQAPGSWSAVAYLFPLIFLALLLF